MKNLMDSKTAYDRYLDIDSDKLDIGAGIVHEEKAPEAYSTLNDAFENYIVRLQTASFREGYEYAMYLMQKTGAKKQNGFT